MIASEAQEDFYVDNEMQDATGRSKHSLKMDERTDFLKRKTHSDMQSHVAEVSGNVMHEQEVQQEQGPKNTGQYLRSQLRMQ